jgi:hypothetical protein
MALDPIDLTALFNTLGITNGNTAAGNQYEFFKGVEWSDSSTTYTAKEFFDKIGGRYSFFKTYESEKSFYAAVADNRIYDYYTFYKWAGEFFGGSSSIISLDNLILYYKFNDDLTDSSTNTYDGGNPLSSPSLAYAADYPGSNTSFGKALDLTGDQNGNAFSSTMEGFDIPTRANGADLTPNNFADTFTVACWVKGNWLNGTDGVNGLLGTLSGGISNEATPFSIYMIGTITYAQRNRGNSSSDNYTITSSAVNLLNNSWHHVLIRFSKTASTGIAARFELWVDGVLRGNNTNLTSNITKLANTTFGWQIGTYQSFNSSGQKYYGQWGNYISDFSIWDRALTTDEIAILSDASNGPLIG